MRGARFVIGGRYHASILAPAAGTPAVLLPANTYKTEGMAALLDYPLGVRLPVDHGGIVADVCAVLEWAGAFRELIAAAVARARRLIGPHEAVLAELLRSLEAGAGAAGIIARPEYAVLRAPPRPVEIEPNNAALYAAASRRRPSLNLRLAPTRSSS